MKKSLTIILYFVLFMLLTYACIASIEVQLNVTQWTSSAKNGFMLLNLAFWIVCSIAVLSIKEAE